MPGLGNSLDPAEKREGALELHKISVARIQDELDKLIKIFSHMRECFENEMMEGMGYKKMALTDKQIKQGAALAKMMTEMIGAKVRYDKAAKTMADSMTAAEEREAVMKYLQSLPKEDLKSFLSTLTAWRDRRNEAFHDHPSREPSK